MAQTLVENLADRFKPESYTDAYRASLEELIKRKVKGEARSAKRRKPEPKVIDLMEALEASVAKARGGSSASGGGRRRSGGKAKPSRRRSKRAAA